MVDGSEGALPLAAAAPATMMMMMLMIARNRIHLGLSAEVVGEREVVGRHRGRRGRGHAVVDLAGVGIPAEKKKNYN